MLQEEEGPLPKTTWLDHFLIIIMVYRLSCTLHDLSIRMKIKLPTLEEVINRARPVLNKTLKERWWKERPRPKPLEETIFPHTALIIDSTSLQIFKPLAKFNEAKK